MNTTKRLGSLVLVLSLTTLISTPSSYGQSRKELKKMCRNQYKACKSQASNRAERKECRQDKKQCRQENGVTFWDDLNIIGESIASFFQKTFSDVAIVMDQDPSHGEYLQLQVSSVYFDQLAGFSYQAPGLDSGISLGDGQLAMTVYSDDLTNNGIGQDLQPSIGRPYPKFYDGRTFNSLYGVEFYASGRITHQLLIDGSEKVFGVFLESRVPGELIKVMNDTKNSIPVVGMLIPDINSIPWNIKAKGEKIGRLSMLSYDASGNNSGFVLLFDHEAIEGLIRKEDVIGIEGDIAGL